MNGKRFGDQKENNNKEVVPLQDGEVIQRMVFGIERNSAGAPYNNGMCGLHFITKIDKYGPYGSGNGVQCEAEYTISRLNSGDMDLHNFLCRNFSAIKNTENGSVNQAESADIKNLIQFLGSLDLKIFS